MDAGYDVRCLVRPRQSPADFLRDWGARTVSGNLASPKTLPAALVGVHTVIDVATARPEESTREVFATPYWASTSTPFIATLGCLHIGPSVLQGGVPI